MKKDEVIMILGIMKTAYPSFYKEMTREEMYNTIDLWYEMLKDFDSKIVVLTVKELINSFKYPPTIADVKSKIYELTNKEEMPAELWNKLAKAVRNGIYGYKEEFKKLPPEVQKFVQNPVQLKEMAMLDSDVFHTVTKGQFLKQIEILKKQEKEEKMMLPEVKKMVQSIGIDVKKLLN